MDPVATSPFEPSSPKNQPLNEPYYEEPEAPVLSLGERIAWIRRGTGIDNLLPEFGIVRWIGRMPQVSPNWTVGVEFVSSTLHTFISSLSLHPLVHISSVSLQVLLE